MTPEHRTSDLSPAKVCQLQAKTWASRIERIFLWSLLIIMWGLFARGLQMGG